MPLAGSIAGGSVGMVAFAIVLGRLP